MDALLMEQVHVLYTVIISSLIYIIIIYRYSI